MKAYVLEPDEQTVFAESKLLQSQPGDGKATSFFPAKEFIHIILPKHRAGEADSALPVRNTSPVTIKFSTEQNEDSNMACFRV